MSGVALLLLILNLKNLSLVEDVRQPSNYYDGELPAGYIVFNDNCQIKDEWPFESQTMKYFKYQKYSKCSKRPPLATVKFDEDLNRYVLTIQNKLRKSYGKDLECCYQKIYRPPYDEDADKRTRFVVHCFVFS